MNSFFDPIERIWRSMQSGHASLPTVATLAPERCWPAGAAGYYIGRDKMYFTVRINEMHLKENRQWYTVYDPLVVVVVEFNHGQERVTVPIVIGPSLIHKQAASDQPRYGTVLLDTRVTGPHPYRGGDVDISVSFYQVQRINYARTLFKIVDKLTSVLGGAGEIAAIAKTGAALLESVEGLLGLDGTVYLAGHRIAMATSPLEPFTAGFSALIAPPVPEDPAGLLVRERRLYIEKNGGSAEPYRDSDFVLLSVTGSQAREDENLLPFYSLKVDALNALWDGEEGIKRGKANLIAAYQQMRKNADVTASEAGLLFDQWMQEFELEKERVEQVRAMPLDASAPRQSPLVEDLDKAARRLLL